MSTGKGGGRQAGNLPLLNFWNKSKLKIVGNIPNANTKKKCLKLFLYLEYSKAISEISSKSLNVSFEKNFWLPNLS
jgi:hypothetical protein